MADITENAADVNADTDPEIAAVQAAAEEADQQAAEINQQLDDQDPFEAARLQAIAEEDTEPRVYTAEDLGVEEDSWLSQKFGEAKSFVNRATLSSEETKAGITQAATLQRAKEQATLAARYKKPAMGDWRVRLLLAEGSDYLYNAANPGILKPLANSNGVIFPYTPAIATNYAANYDKYELMHSNFRGYFYKNSTVGDITITATFTAQDTQEANYMLAVIHFFRSVTKMFYGKDAQRGAPPPLVYLVGLGDYQFSGHPCLVSNFAYNLPADVDYIRAGTPNNQGTNLLDTENATVNSSATSSVLNRLKNAFLPRGALPQIPAINNLLGSVNNISGATYVPTKIEITLTLLPVNTRSQVSQQFSLKGFANGDLLKGGFW